ncbi:MAG: PLAT/LH2 domain-containing protein [Solirubrobacterales bacterium]
MRPKLVGICVSAVLLIFAAPASAFDTGPHFDISRDALQTEGFGATASDVVTVNNWFVDLYANAGSIPHSGHSEWWRTLLGGGYFAREHWPTSVVHGALRSHFDYSGSSVNRRLTTTPEVQQEWDRLRRATYSLALKAKADNDPAALLSVLGMSLHTLQDFYSHSNWIEPQGVEGVDGPNWQNFAQGATPTWFDVPADVLAQTHIYSTGHPVERRAHGGWHSDKNRSMKTGVNKDWPGRLGYNDSYMTAFFATRQWIQAIRTWVADDGFWFRARSYANRHGSALNHDIAGATNISQFSGHWQGQGEPIGSGRSGPGGSLLSLRNATEFYFEGRRKTVFRRKFQSLIGAFGDPNAPGELGPVPKSDAMQRLTRFVRMQVLSIKGIDLGDTLPGDGADMFAKAVIGGQRFMSGEINDKNSYSFPKPNHAFSFIRSVPSGTTYGEPVNSLLIEVRTSSSRYSGTDDDVYLRINGARRFALDKRLYDDFERGDRDTYSLPIDDAARAGLTVGDLQFLQIEKSRDGVAGGWKLRGVKVMVNGREIFARDGIEQWLENNKRTWRAPGFVPAAPQGAAVPFVLDLWEADWGLAGGNDHGDINRHDRRKAIVVGYSPGAPPIQEVITGGSAYGGRLGDGDKARLTYRVDTLDPVPPPAPAKPDLVITEFLLDSITVKNVGGGAAGPFKLARTMRPVQFFSGLAPGASETRSYVGGCDGFTATVDSDNEVDESNEFNNSAALDIIC